MSTIVRIGVRLRSFIVIVLSLGVVTIGTSLAPTFSRAETASVPSSDVAARRAQLQSELDQLNSQINATQSTLTTLGSQHKSLQNDINILDAQIKKAQLQLKATQVQISALQNNISIHNSAISTLTGKLSSEQQSLAQIIRKTNEIDNYSLVELVMSSEDVSSFFGDLDSFSSLKQELGASYDQTADTRTQKEIEKQQLEDQHTQQVALEQEERLEQQQIKDAQAKKQALLSSTKKQESNYQSVLTIQQQTAAQIRAELFALAGGSGQISLPAAIALAKQAGSAVGVRPALVLGILKQETNIGANVGVAGSWVTEMSPTRDIPVFKVVMATLGLDPNTVKVSKAQGNGWGGAMGPAQFIPSTWACYAGYINTTTGSCGKGTDGTYAGPWAYSAAKDRIAKAAGHPNTPSNPWNNLDAFTATAMLMADNGATAKTFQAERLAALRYYAGWGGATNPAYAFYGDGVMGFAAQFQSDIDTLAGG